MQGQQVRWMRLRTGEHRIRLVGNHVKFYRLQQDMGLIVHPSFGDLWDELRQRGLALPLECYAIHVIDRSDGDLKLLEGDRGLFKQFSAYKADTGINPAGKDGPDFLVHVDSDGVPTATPQTREPFTRAEIDMIQQGRYPLKELFASASAETAQQAIRDLAAAN